MMVLAGYDCLFVVSQGKIVCREIIDEKSNVEFPFAEDDVVQYVQTGLTWVCEEYLPVRRENL
jgi:hypothetical protein